MSFKKRLWLHQGAYLNLNLKVNNQETHNRYTAENQMYRPQQKRIVKMTFWVWYVFKSKILLLIGPHRVWVKVIIYFYPTDANFKMQRSFVAKKMMSYP